MTTTYLISGASRGLGLETARQLLALSPSNQIIAAARTPSKAAELQKLIKENPGRIEAVTLDVKDAASIKSGVAAASKLDLAKNGIDVLINNAGVAGSRAPLGTALQAQISDFEEVYRVNVYGAVSLTQEAMPLLRAGKSKKIFTTSSNMGSIQWQKGSAMAAAYSSSKAAVNMYFAKLATELADEKFTVIVHCPGWVKTDMNGGVDGPAVLYVEDSVSQTIKNVFSKGLDESGKFYQYDGKELPW
ncbi:hypothetical protein MNV49_002178 [Pseudohyphozyma bogoriensis]|nr:hypothetical protein MNV49_002178 [Pseudohyphozyma bogoriensis]